MNNKLFEMWKDDIEAFLEDTSYHAALSEEARRSAAILHKAFDHSLIWPFDSSYRVLEVGAGNGIHTVILADVCKWVTVIEARPHNLAKAFLRTKFYNQNNLSFQLGNVQELDESCGRYDGVFHFGVLYHLSEPVRHILNLAKITDLVLCDTHIGDQLSDRWDEGEYQAYRYKESGWNDPLSGVEDWSRWLTKESMFNAFQEAGFKFIYLQQEYDIKFGLRIRFIASKNKLKKSPYPAINE
jgi:tRNA (mo5U34)-methyltransferase